MKNIKLLLISLLLTGVCTSIAGTVKPPVSQSPSMATVKPPVSQ